MPTSRLTSRMLLPEPACITRSDSAHAWGVAGRLGISTQFVALPIDVTDPKIWGDIKLRYWQLDTYFLPVCQYEDGDADCDGSTEAPEEAK
jgi:hypothetical protein